VSTHEELVVIPVQEGESLCLGSPDVGLFTGALEQGAWVDEGQIVGKLSRLGRTTPLRAPTGFAGPGRTRAQIASPPPERVLEPVGFGTILYELVLGEGQGEEAPIAPASELETFVVPAPQSGRFYHRPGPDNPPFLNPGDELQEGTTLGLIEVMKTFAHVSYHPGKGLPDRVRMLAWVAEDGAEVREGDPLLEFEPL
jgi:acetyl-CoA carboxylase biotin carboxyl carrier protein